MPRSSKNKNSTPTWNPRRPARVAVELCSGMGAIGLGLKSLGFQVAHAYDSWDCAVDIYNHNAAQSTAEICDLLSRAGRQHVLSQCRKLGGIDLLVAGPPCKGFSQIRNGRHNNALARKQNKVLAAMPGYVAALKPQMFLIENVPDLIRHRDGKTLQDLLKSLATPGPRKLRYRVEYKIYDAALSGTPQARRRIFILGVRDGKEVNLLPDPGPDLAPLFSALRHGKKVPAEFSEYRTSLKDPEDLRLTTARQALADIPRLSAGVPEVGRSYAANPVGAFQRLMREGAPAQLSDTRTPSVRQETIDRLALIKPGGCARDIPKEKLNGLSRRFDSAYRRLHPDAPSTALSTKYDCVYHYSCARSLSVREYARLQGIPDFFTFPETLACRRHAYEMIGNSVPPLMIRKVLGGALRKLKS